jgi:hypothetical protein
MRPRGTCVFAAGVLATLIVSAGAGAKSDAGPQIDVSSAPAARDYLRSIGIDPSGFVVQRGVRNYAGPACPGPGWNCTTATRVIQIATHAGRNTFDCEAPAAGTDEANNTCVSTQSSAHGNTSRCVIRSHASTVDATCTITQTSAHGDNRAFIEMVADQSEGSRHRAVFKATVRQTSATGDNRLHSSQKVEQDAKSHGGTVEQKQEGKLNLVVDQISGSGKQEVQMRQSLDQDAKAQGYVLGGSQDQFGDLFGNIDQTSAGRSEIHARQDEDQDEQAPKGSRVAQSQVGPSECCTRQLGNPGNRFDINQNASQQASQERAFQSEIIKGSCISSGNCDVDQAARNNVDRERNSCTGHVCFIFIICRSGEDGDDGEDDDDGEKRFLAVRWHEGGGCESGSGSAPS